MPIKSTEKRKAYEREYRRKNKEKTMNWRKENPEKCKEYSRKYYSTHRDIRLKIESDLHLSMKEKVFNHYGKFCACCGESEVEFLTIDHIAGGGTQQRLKIGSSSGFYKWLVKSNFPEGFQTLCFNCNCARSKPKNQGICPHQRQLKLLLKKVD